MELQSLVGGVHLAARLGYTAVTLVSDSEVAIAQQLKVRAKSVLTPAFGIAWSGAAPSLPTHCCAGSLGAHRIPACRPYISFGGGILRGSAESRVYGLAHLSAVIAGSLGCPVPWSVVPGQEHGILARAGVGYHVGGGGFLCVPAGGGACSVLEPSRALAHFRLLLLAV